MEDMRRLLVLVAIALLAEPTVASAGDLPGTYVVSSCALGDQRIPLTGWYKEIPGTRIWATSAAGPTGVCSTPARDLRRVGGAASGTAGFGTRRRTQS
jgi:hypothetical protein